MSNTEHDSRIIIGGWIADCRKRAGYSQAEVTMSTGITQPRQSKLEHLTGSATAMEVALLMELYKDSQFDPFPWDELRRLKSLEFTRAHEFVGGLMGRYLQADDFLVRLATGVG